MNDSLLKVLVRTIGAVLWTISTQHFPCEPKSCECTHHEPALDSVLNFRHVNLLNAL